MALGLEVIPALVANGTALSAGVPIGAKTLVGISMPATWTAAAMTFQVSPDGGTTWQELTDGASAAITFTAPASNQFVPVDPTKWRGINMIKVRSGTSGSPVNQGQDSSVGLVVRPL